MKILSAQFLVTLTAAEIGTLTAQVSETLATDQKNTKKIFTAADLWSIQKNKRTISRISLRRVY